MARVVKKLDADAGFYPEEQVDVQAIVVRWDKSLRTIVVDTGNIHPAIASYWLFAAAGHMDVTASEMYVDVLTQDELG